MGGSGSVLGGESPTAVLHRHATPELAAPSRAGAIVIERGGVGGASGLRAPLPTGGSAMNGSHSGERRLAGDAAVAAGSPAARPRVLPPAGATPAGIVSGTPITRVHLSHMTSPHYFTSPPPQLLPPPSTTLPSATGGGGGGAGMGGFTTLPLGASSGALPAAGSSGGFGSSGVIAGSRQLPGHKSLHTSGDDGTPALQAAATAPRPTSAALVARLQARSRVIEAQLERVEARHVMVHRMAVALSVAALGVCAGSAITAGFVRVSDLAVDIAQLVVRLCVLVAVHALVWSLIPNRAKITKVCQRRARAQRHAAAAAAAAAPVPAAAAAGGGATAASGTAAAGAPGSVAGGAAAASGQRPSRSGGGARAPPLQPVAE